MIDATKLKHGQRYYVTSTRNAKPIEGAWCSDANAFYCDGLRIERIAEVLTAIPIPSPEKLSEMWDVIGDVVSGVVTNRTMQTARTLLEKRV